MRLGWDRRQRSTTGSKQSRQESLSGTTANRSRSPPTGTRRRTAFGSGRSIRRRTADGKATPPALTAALSERLLGTYRFCFLFTDLANPTANRIYEQIGYRRVCEAAEIAFD